MKKKAFKTMTIENLKRPPEIRHDLTQCPFCGASPQIEFWHGGGPQKRMISCSGDDCPINPMTTGETKRAAIARWERRAP